MAASGEAARPARRESGAMTLITPHIPTRPVTAAEVPFAAATLAAAFHDDPIFAWWIPDARRRREILPGFFRVVVEGGLQAGAVHTTHDFASVAVWNAPGAEDDEEAVDAIARIADEHVERLFVILEGMAEAHPAQEHFYLFFLATRPDRQSRGLGSAAMRPVLESCDAGATPAYLEATTERNAELYRRHGFEVVGEIALPDGPSLWPMWREPRG
jgi:ribosomal protein S18 acetylase RimI-like enzyme